MDALVFRKAAIILALAFVGWALCAAIMGIGIPVIGLQTTLIVHAIAAPMIFGALAAIYFMRFHFTTPVQTALALVAFVIFMDTVVVALLIQKSFAMFGSVLGTWLPFALIFIATVLVGTSRNHLTRSRQTPYAGGEDVHMDTHALA
jgi:hypothetical protein